MTTMLLVLTLAANLFFLSSGFTVVSVLLLLMSFLSVCGCNFRAAFCRAVSLSTTMMMVGSDRWLLPVVIGNCVAVVVVILPQRYWRDADGRCFFFDGR